MGLPGSSWEWCGGLLLTQPAAQLQNGTQQQLHAVLFYKQALKVLRFTRPALQSAMGGKSAGRLINPRAAPHRDENASANYTD